MANTDTVSGGYPRSWIVQVNQRQRPYSSLVEVNPFVILLREISSGDIKSAVETWDDEVVAEINCAKNLTGFNYFSASPRKQAYLAMQRSR